MRKVSKLKGMGNRRSCVLSVRIHGGIKEIGVYQLMLNQIMLCGVATIVVLKEE